ncbi:MAG: hypothetical protein UY18_C0039G0004 [Microgenomates group bacterium GW2011_GWF2_47_9]|nr:MAG: hypothetical protein UY18_C0039G0004 [Microgenomates group bacterium GW2011_GWF2_47_9]
MSGINKLKDNIEVYESIGGLMEVYEEMAAKAMREIREEILSGREYYQGLAELSASVGADLSLFPYGQKRGSAIVLFSADEGLYGEILDRVFDSFLTAIRQDRSAQIYLSGKAGIELMKLFEPGVKYTVLPVPTGKDSFKEVVGALWGYKKIEFYFGQFESLARQIAVNRQVTAKEIMQTIQGGSSKIVAKLKYLYEPDVAEVSRVFGQEIFTGILDQTIKEGELARNASRLMHLDQALGKVESRLDKVRGGYLKMKKKLVARKQNSAVAGYMALRQRGRHV